MTRTFRTRIATSALVLMLGSAAAVGQDMQLNDSARTGIAQLGITLPENATVTADQAALVENVLSSSGSREIQSARIQEILGLSESTTTDAGSDTPRLQDSVRTDMAALGMDTSAVGSLTVEQLGQIQNITSSGDDEVAQQRRIEQVLTEAGFAPAVSTAAGDPTNGLNALVSADLAKLGMNEVDVDALPLEKLTLIRGVTSSSDDDVQQRSRVERILAE